MMSTRVHGLLALLAAIALLGTPLLVSPAWSQDETAQDNPEAAEATNNAATSSLPPDEVIFKDGSRLLGTIKSMEGGVLTFESASTQEEVKIKFEQVDSIKSSSSHRFVLKDGGTSVGIPNKSAPGKTQVGTEHTGVLDIDLASVEAINPAEKRSVTHRGSIALTASIQDGNTKSKDVDAIANYIVEFEKRRLSFDGFWNYGREDGETNDRDAFARGKYDYFVNDHLFYYGNASMRGDNFNNVKLIATLGGGIGWQYYDSEDLDVYLEGGASWIDQNYEDGTDNRHIAGRASLNVNWNIIRDHLIFFMRHEYFFGFEAGDDRWLISNAGLNVNIAGGLYATSQIIYEHHLVPAPGEEDEDWNVLLGLGYAFDF